MPEKIDFDVVVIGLGPTGGTLANLLAMQGLSVCVLEREASLYNLPRAVHFDDEIMRVFQTIGIANRLRRHLIVNRGTKFINPEGEVLIDWPRPRAVTENGWQPSYRFHQPDLERCLRRALAQYELVTITPHARTTNIRDHGDHVEICFAHAGEVANKVLRARYVVGCDGARSVTRSSMGVEMADLGFEQTWVVIDLVLTSSAVCLPDRTIQYCNPDRPATYCRNVGRRRRWEFAVGPDEEPEAMLVDAAIWDYLSPWISPEAARLERKAIYTFKSAIAKQWLEGRVFIAGDAAHLMPPFMGQGMCAGIRDAANLAWKISFCVKHGHDDELARSYQREREQNVREYIETTSRMGEFINALGDAQIANTVFAKPDGTIGMNSIAPSLGTGLGDAADPLLNKTFPNITLADGSSFDQKFSMKPIIIASSAIVDLSDFTKRTTMDGKIITTDQLPELGPVLRQFGVAALLLRPDRRVLASCQDGANFEEFQATNRMLLS